MKDRQFINPSKDSLSRRNFLRMLGTGSGLGITAATLSACKVEVYLPQPVTVAPSEGERVLVTTVPKTEVPTQAVVPVATETTVPLTQRPSPTGTTEAEVVTAEVVKPTIKPEVSGEVKLVGDALIKKTIEEAREGEQVVLRDVLIDYVVAVPIPLIKDAYYAVASRIDTDGQKHVLFTISSGDCVFDEVRKVDLGEQKGEGLGPFKLGVWQPSLRITELKGRMRIIGAGLMMPMVDATEITVEDTPVVCESNPIVPKGAARSAAVAIGTAISEVVEGLQEGLNK